MSCHLSTPSLLMRMQQGHHVLMLTADGMARQPHIHAGGLTLNAAHNDYFWECSKAIMHALAAAGMTRRHTPLLEAKKLTSASGDAARLVSMHLLEA
eukprot:1149718-Pelagomonas_calceolata.AAC.9